MSAQLDPRTERTITDPDALIDEALQVRECGYASDNEEFMEDMIAVAVPILDGNRRLVSTLSFHAPVQRLAMSDAIGHVGRLKSSAEQLSALISESDEPLAATGTR